MLCIRFVLLEMNLSCCIDMQSTYFCSFVDFGSLFIYLFIIMHLSFSLTFVLYLTCKLKNSGLITVSMFL